MTFPIVMYGGPQDGTVYALQKEDVVIRLPQIASPPFMIDDETSPLTTVSTDYIQYLRTKEFASNGARIYRYVPNG